MNKPTAETKPTTETKPATANKPDATKPTAETKPSANKPETTNDQTATKPDSTKPADSNKPAANKPETTKPSAVAAASSTKPVVAPKTSRMSEAYKKGYDWGKTNTNNATKAGGQTLKAAFSPKSMLLGAGLTVGMKIVQQVRSGEKVDIGAAVKYLGTGEYIGGYVGGGLGAAAGSAIGAFMSGGIPVIGPVIGAFMPAAFALIGGSLGAQMGNGIATGRRPSLKEAWSSIDKGDLAGRAIGSTVGMMIGSALLPGIGTFIGGFVGNLVGGKIVSWIRGKKGDDLSQIRIVGPGMVQVLTTPSSSSSSGNVQVHQGITNHGNNGNAVSLKQRMEASYKRYSQLLGNGQGNSQAATQALREYKEAYNEYVNSMSKSR